MGLIQKIKREVENAGFAFYYDSGNGLNQLLDGAYFSDNKTVVFAFQLSTTNLVDGKENGSIGLFFSRLTELDFEAIENEEIQEATKADAWKFIKQTERGNLISLGEIQIRRFYDEFSVNVTGVAVNTTITEVSGLKDCVSDYVNNFYEHCNNY